MNGLVDYAERGPTDLFHFGITFFGVLFGIAGVVATAVWAFILGGVFVTMGLAYFLLGT